MYRNPKGDNNNFSTLTSWGERDRPVPGVTAGLRLTFKVATESAAPLDNRTPACTDPRSQKGITKSANGSPRIQYPLYRAY